MVLVLAFPASAHAGWRLDRSIAVAEKVWHAPCGGQVTVLWAPLPETVGAVAAREACTVTLTTAYRLPFAALCSVMIHEVGHLAGVQHSLNPRSVMYEWRDFNYGFLRGRLVRVMGADRRCFDRGREYLGMRPKHYGWA